MSKDINMRVKARVLGLHAEDYTNDKVLEDTDLLYTGVLQLPASFWDKNGKGMESWQHGGFTYYRINGPIVERACWSISSCIWKTARHRFMRRCARSAASPRCCACCATTRTRRTRSGA